MSKAEPNKKNMSVVAYNPEWPAHFEHEATLIKHALGSNCIAIHHIGSTAVPGLIAKAKIDIILVVDDPEQAKKELEPLGFVYKGEYNIPLHYGFGKRGAVDVNLHVYEADHPEIEYNLLFRDYLRNNHAARDAYTQLKQQLIADETSQQKNNSAFTNYTLRKGDFIRSIMAQTGFNPLRILRCNDQTEWDAARRLAKQELPEAVNNAEHAHVILYRGVTIVGYAYWQINQKGEAALRMMVIDEQHKGMGLEGAFLKLCEKWLKKLGYAKI